MLILPILVGVAASSPAPWHLALAGAALSGYLASAAFQGWSRSRRGPVYRRPLLVYTATFAAISVPLLAMFPALLLVLVVGVPAGLIVVAGAKPATRRDLASSLSQVALAVTLVPASAWVSGMDATGPVVAGTLVAAGYLVGTVLVVRSVIRERSNPRFAAASVVFHLALVVAAAAWLPTAYVLIAVLLAVRAAAFPLLQRRLAASPRPLRPVHLGIAEMVASTLVVTVAFVVPLPGLLPSLVPG